ncbi:Succinate dehydrogenase assembly factor 4, mitochondrial [Tolypocladium capitatum]|uniref:Succinate dehydrogenase assembly factor 4, mitochondrial n=1 Tax=Tolypocladium capitatum TaxID=45235 RepID=A0A2K3QHJ0_9HYPO|nr:Succinate dehydrogenase assembly factor 4, mitochondrial [Tolypocladium capitatum]
MPRLTPLSHPLRLLSPLRHSTRASSTFTPRPSPPKLPADQQAEFERLQRTAVSSAFRPQPGTSPSAQRPLHATDTAATATAAVRRTDDAADDADVNQGLLFRGAPPEFQGDVNPKTGEVGGPKNEPLRWGGAGDWSYNGRVTDF